jgi:hypothetical protein
MEATKQNSSIVSEDIFLVVEMLEFPWNYFGARMYQQECSSPTSSVLFYTLCHLCINFQPLQNLHFV